MGRASISYSNKDYESIRRELVARIPQLTDRWTDFNKSDLGVVLLELFCGVGDMLSYYLDAQAAEAFLPTARQRQNVINLCKLISYRLDTPVAASTLLRFTISAPLNDDLMIPAGCLCRARLDDGDVEFETVFDATIARGQREVEVSARQGKTRSENFTGTGQPWQRFVLANRNVAQGSVKVSVQNEDWTEAPHFQESDADSKDFLTETDGLDVSSIAFGDGSRGAVPPSGELIEVEYLETQGASGNIGRGLVTEVMTPVYLNGIQVALSVINSTPSTGGADRETIAHARRQAPAEVRSLWKAVTKDDYTALAEGYPGVAKAQVLDTNDCSNIRYYNVNIAVAPDGGGLPSSLLKDELLSYLESRKVITIEIRLFDPVYVPVNIDAEVYVYAGEDLDLARSRIEDALSEHLAFDRVGFGQDIHFSDLVAAMDGARGVSHARVFTPLDDIRINAGEIPTLGEVILDMKRAS